MSTGIKLRSRRKYTEGTSIKIAKSSKKRYSDFLLAADFNSETLSSSSPLKLDITSEKRVRKRKIRSTQDFNHLSSSFTSQESDESTKSRKKKTKKSKNLYKLPEISRLSDNVFMSPQNINSNTNTDEPLQKKRNNKTLKQCNNEKVVRESAEKSDNLNKLHSTDRQSTDEGANSVISDSQMDSEVEIVTKDRKKLKQKHRATKKNTSLKELESVKSYANRIKMILKEENIRRTKSNEANSSSCLSSPLSASKCDRRSIYNKTSTPNLRDINNSIRSTRLSKTNKLECTNVFIRTMDEQTENIKEQEAGEDNVEAQNKMEKGNRKSVRFLSPEQNRNRRETITLTESKILDQLNYNNNEILPEVGLSLSGNTKRNSTFENTSSQINQVIEIPNQNLLINSVKKGPRKSCDSINSSVKRKSSVQFSPVKKISGQCTDSNVKNSFIDLITPSPIKHMAFEDISGSATSSQIINKGTKIPNQNSLINSVKKGPRKSCDSINSSAKRKSSKQFSPVKKISKKCDSNVKNSVIDLITPSPIKHLASEDVSASATFNNVGDLSGIMELNRQSTFIRDDETVTRSVKVEETKIQESNISISESVPNLVRTATFTKDDIQSPNILTNLEFNSPVQTNTCVNAIDTSRVNKRRRWDKSRLSVSFLEQSLDIADTSAPWQDTSNLNPTEVNISKHNLEDECRPDIEESKAVSSLNKYNSFKNTRTPPSSTSTPLPRGKNNLLRQALLNDKDKTLLENKKQNEKVERPKIIRTKVPNFALIHQRAMDKLENIKEMSERKAARAKLLLSGHKPPKENMEKTSRRKELTFSPSLSKLATTEKNIIKTLNKSNISITKIKNISPSKSNPTVANKENRLTPLEKKKELLQTKSRIPKATLPKTVVTEKKGFTRFGFKIVPGVSKEVAKVEQLKAVATKTKILKNTLEERRNMIQGVRSNRRFELLMKMRNK